MSGKGQDVGKQIEQVVDMVGAYAKPMVHWGFIPAVILVGMLCTKPRPTLGQLFFMG